MKKIKVLADGGLVFCEYQEISPRDVWRMHRDKKLPEFLPTAWTRDGRGNPLLARLRVIHFKILYWLSTTVGVISALVTFIRNDLTWWTAPLAISSVGLSLWYAYNREHRLAENCSRVYAEHVCWLFNSQSRSCAYQEQSSSIPGDGFDDRSVKALVESWLVKLLVIVHKNENPPADLSVDKKLTMLKRAADKMVEFRTIASAGQSFGLVGANFEKLHQSADELIKQENEKGITKARVQVAWEKVDKFAKEMLGKTLVPKST